MLIMKLMEITKITAVIDTTMPIILLSMLSMYYGTYADVSPVRLELTFVGLR